MLSSFNKSYISSKNVGCKTLDIIKEKKVKKKKMNYFIFINNQIL